MQAGKTHEPGGMFFAKPRKGNYTCRKVVIFIRWLWMLPDKLPQRNISQVRWLITGLLAPDNAFLPGVNCGLGAICEVKFAQDIADMAFDGTNADDEFVSDFLIGEASGN
jgi:hypothetical protein